MSLLNRLLPQPTQSRWDDDDDERTDIPRKSTALVAVAVTAPPYGQRKGWIPRNTEDFGDGGAFPEIVVAQYPLDMGRPNRENKSNALAVQLDAEGNVKYDIIARQGQRKDKIVYSKLTDMMPAEITSNDSSLQKPDSESINETIEKTRLALEKITNSKISAALPVRAAPKQPPAQFIRYTPSQEGNAFNSGAKQRVIRMVEVQQDPMEPPKFRINKKIPRGPPSPPAPVMHSPTRKVTAKEQKEWKIPPCISNWKNAKGYTIPLDKRLAADGRGLQQVHVNEKFAHLAEALFVADRKSREEVEARNQMEKKVVEKEKAKKEEHLRQLAQKAREDRAAQRNNYASDKHDDNLKERNRLRNERHRDRVKEANISRAAPDKRNKIQRERERDISEQLALGLPTKTKFTGEQVFDQRLFNNDGGMNSGFGDGEDEDYNVYDKPWREKNTLPESVYRPSKSVTDDFEKNRGPIEFEKQDDDPFGLDTFLSEAKHAKKRQRVDEKSSSSKDDKKRKY